LGIGRNSKITGAIIDKNAHLGENVVILPFPCGTNYDGNHWMVRDGIVVVPKNSTVKSGSYIGPIHENFLSRNQIEKVEDVLDLLPLALPGS
jgi:hypothetical protein